MNTAQILTGEERGCRPGGTFSILVVDDDPGVRRALERTLASQGHRVHTAEDGAAGWQRFQELEPAIVICDIRMPGMDGIELLGRVRAASPHTEVVLITGFSDTDVVIEALRRGASNFVEKPFRPAELLAQLESSFLRCGLTEERRQLEEDLDAERRRLEVASRMATMGRLLAGLAHEVHNPLTFLKGNVELVHALLARLREPEADRDRILDEVDDYLSDMAFGAQRIQELIDDLKRFAAPRRLGTGSVPVAQVLENARRISESKRPRTVDLACSEFPDALLDIDPVDLEGCVVNLLVNAYEALGERGGTVCLGCQVVPFPAGAYRGLVEISVEDDGPGIAGDVLEDVFTPFFSLKEGGTGLGLSLAYEAAKRNDGQLEIDSRPGEGVRAIVRIPYGRAPTAPADADSP